MSTINTNGINVNYPVPGVNNSSQGFRDNFAAIKTNLDTAGSEISDLQSKVVLKQALANTTINNDMGNTLISNAATRNFRATSFNLGNALANTVSVDTTLADVFYGTISANTTLSFTNWAPAGTERVIQLQLAVSNANAFLTLSENTVVQYYMGDYFKPETYSGFRYDDPFFSIPWPHSPMVISDRDASFQDFSIA